MITETKQTEKQEARPMRLGEVTSDRTVLNKYKGKRERGTYALNMTVTLELGDSEFCSKCTDQRGRVSPVLKDIAIDLPYGVKGYSGASYWNYYDKKCPDCSWSNAIIRGVTIKFVLPADSAKEILSESQAQKAIAKAAPENKERGYGTDQDRPLTLEQILVARTASKFIAFEANIMRAKVADQACRIAAWAAGNADEKARVKVGFKARLEALEAELKAAQQEALEAFITDEMEDGLKDGEWYPEAIKLGAEAAHKLHPAAIPSIFSGRNHDSVVKPEDVVLND